MSFQIPNYSPRDKENRFEFRVPRHRWWNLRRKYSLPLMQFVSLATMEKAKSAEKPLQLSEIARMLDEPAAARAIWRLNQPEIQALERAWLEASAVGLGELLASSTS